MSDGWLGQFKPAISSYDYYVDFDKAVANAQRWKPELHLMNSLIGSKSIEADFMRTIAQKSHWLSSPSCYTLRKHPQNNKNCG